MVFGFLLTVLGGAIFGPWGMLAGSLLGAALFPAKAPKTPTPEAPTSETFSYGVPIKKIWNRYRLGGTRVWQTDIGVERIPGKKHGFLIFTTGQEPDQFRYRASWATMLCEGPIVAVRKIWADGKLIYDVSEDNTAEGIATSRAMESGTLDKIVICKGDENQLPIPEMALADPDHEHPAYRGRAMIMFYQFDVTSYGGRIPEINAEILERAEVTLDEWQDVSEEMTTGNEGRLNAGYTVGMGGLWMVGGYKWTGSDIVDTDEVQRAVMNDDGSLTWEIKKPLQEGRGELEVVYSPYGGLGFPEKLIAMGGYAAGIGTYYDEPDGDSGVSKMVQELTSASGVWAPQPILGDEEGITQGRIPFPRDSFAAAVFNAPYPWGFGIWIYGGRCTRADHNLSWIGPFSSLQDIWFYNEGNTWQLLTEIQENEYGYDESEDGGAGYRIKATMLEFNQSLFLLGGLEPGGEGGLQVGLRDVYVMRFSGPFPRFVQTNSDIMHDWPDEDKKDDYYIAGATVWRNRLVALVSKCIVGQEHFILWVSDDGITWEIFNKGVYPILYTQSGSYRIAGDHTDDISIGDTLTAVGESNFYEHDVTNVSKYGNDTLIEVDGGIAGLIPSGTLYIHMVARNARSTGDTFYKNVGFETYLETLYLLGGIDSIPRDDLILINKVKNSVAYPTTIQLKDVVSDLCTVDAELDKALIDTSQLTDPVIGVCAANRPLVSEMIEMLRQYGFFDAVESDGIEKFIKRGGSSMATITDDDLAAAEPNKSDRPEKLTITYEQALDLPRSVEVIYPDVDQDYLEGAQIARRSVSEARQSVTLNLTIVMDGNQAARVAEINLWEYWASRAILNWQTSYRYLHLDPADVVTLDVEGHAHVSRIKSMDFGTPRVIKFQSVMEESQIYSDVNLDGLGVIRDDQPPNTMAQDIPTTGVFLDIPILSMSDDDFGFYFGAYPTTPEELAKWKGADLYLKDTDSEEWLILTRLTNPLTSGTVAVPLPTSKTTAWDYTHVLQVELILGSLTTASEDEVLAGANLALYGNEILQFCQAENVSGNTWNLSQLLRGRFGTEHEVGNHTADERFILLDRNALIRVSSDDSTIINHPLTWCVTSRQGKPGLAEEIVFTCHAIGKKPYSPADLNAVRLTNGYWRITWLRRVRGNPTWSGGFPLPLNEEFERYEIDFLVDDQVVHTQEVEIHSLSPRSRPYFELPIDGYFDGVDYQYGQNEIFGGVADSIHIKIYQRSSAVGRGFPAEGIFTVEEES